MRPRHLILLVIFGLTLSGHAIAETFRPFDEAGRDPTFKVFRAQFLEIVRNRDLSLFKSQLHPNVRMSLGNGSGLSEAIQIMRQEPARWAILERILGNGGRFKTFNESSGPVRMFFAPYTFFAELGDGSEVFNVAVVVGENVNVRLGPSNDTKVVARLSHWIVRALSPSGEGRHWIQIRTRDGKIGFVNSKYIAWPTDYRAGFQKHEGHWKLRVFLAGD